MQRSPVLGAIFGVWALLAAIASGFVVGTVGALPFAVVPRGKREKYTIHAAVVWARFVLRQVLFVQPRVTGDIALPPGTGALLLCNHRSWLDPILLIAYTRSNGLSKSQIFWIPVIGFYGWLTGAVFFDRGDLGERHRARDEVLYLLGRGHRVQVFPEGTRSVDGTLRQKVYLRLAVDCYGQGTPVIPCAVRGTERALPPYRYAAWPGQPARLDIGAPIWPRDYPDAKAFAQACWEDVVRRVKALDAEKDG